MIELLCAVLIIGALIAGALFTISSYSAWARQTSDKQTLTVLNDTLTRYKCEGGDLTALTLGAPIGRVLAKLATPIQWTGQTHYIMTAAKTYPASSLSVSGSGPQYRFTRYNTYTHESGGVTYPNINTSAGGLVGWWKFDEGSGSTTADSSGNQNSATINSGVSWTNGHSGYALQGIVGSVGITGPLSNASSLNLTSAITVSIWVYQTAYANYTNYILNPWNSGHLIMFSDATGQLGFGVNTTSTYAPFQTNGWHNFVGVYDGNKIYLYIDGALGSQKTVGAFNIAYPNAFSFMLGNCPCAIDDVRIYNRALSSSEVAQLSSQ
jgi:type II secretory pathway pseudopilin PulG